MIIDIRNGVQIGHQFARRLFGFPLPIRDEQDRLATLVLHTASHVFAVIWYSELVELGRKVLKTFS